MGVKWADIDKNLQDKLLSSVDRNSVQFNPQGVANTLLAVNQMGVKWADINKNLQVKLLSSVDRNAVQFNPQEIANTLLAVNQMGVKWADINKNLQDKLLSSVDRNAVQFNPQDVLNTLLSFDGMGLEIIDLRNTRNILLEAIARLCPAFESWHVLICAETLDHIGFFWKDFSGRLQTEFWNSIKQSYTTLKVHERGMLTLRLSRLSMPQDMLESLDSLK